MGPADNETRDDPIVFREKPSGTDPIVDNGRQRLEILVHPIETTDPLHRERIVKDTIVGDRLVDDLEVLLRPDSLDNASAHPFVVFLGYIVNCPPLIAR